MKKLEYGILTKNEYLVLELRLEKKLIFDEIARRLHIKNRSNVYTVFQNGMKKLKSAKKLISKFNI